MGGNSVYTKPMNTYAPIGTVLSYRGEDVVVICHDMEQTHYKVEAVDKRRFWIAASRVPRHADD